MDDSAYQNKIFIELKKKFFKRSLKKTKVLNMTLNKNNLLTSITIIYDIIIIMYDIGKINSYIIAKIQNYLRIKFIYFTGSNNFKF